MKKFFLLAFFSLLFISCEKSELEEERGVCCALPRPSYIIFQVTSEEGLDLLNPQNEGAFIENEISSYYYDEDGEIREVHSYYLPHGREIYEPQEVGPDYYRIKIGLNTSSDQPVTYLKWNDNDIDTIVNSYNEYFTKFDKIWYNGELIDDYEDHEIFFEVIK